MKVRSPRLFLFFVLTMLTVAGCSDDKANPIAAFEPEVINNADAFQFQITGATGVTTTVEYSWSNTGTRATVDHSTSLTGGSASVLIFDADRTQVYSGSLVASATVPTEFGTSGVWTVRVVFSDFRGTANFRVEKL